MGCCAFARWKAALTRVMLRHRRPIARQELTMQILLVEASARAISSSLVTFMLFIAHPFGILSRLVIA